MLHTSFKWLFLWGMVALIALTLPTLAQSEPTRTDLQNAVLADMSTRTGNTVTLNSLSRQFFFFGTYEFVTGLGCAAAPPAAPTTGDWHRFEYTYAGDEYVYIVADNLEALILCNEATLGTPIPPTPTATLLPSATSTPLAGTGQQGGGSVVAATPTFTPSPTTTGTGQSGGGTASTGQVINIDTSLCPLPTRLATSEGGRVLPGDPNWVHEGPSRDSFKTGEIPAGETFFITGDPVCDADSTMVYYPITYGGGFIGWTSEGLGAEYWLEPYVQATNILVDNIAQVGIPEWASLIPADQSPLAALSADGTYLAVMTDATTLSVIDTTTSTVNWTTTVDVPVSFLYIAPDNSNLVFATQDNRVEVRALPLFTPRTSFAQSGNITALTMPPRDNLLVIATDEPVLYLWDVRNTSAPLRTIQLPQTVTDMQFTDDNSILFMRNAAGEFVATLSFPTAP